MLQCVVAAGIPLRTLNYIKVRTMNGRVILSGQIDGLDEKQRLELVAGRTPGVKTVISQLMVVRQTRRVTPGATSDVGRPGAEYGKTGGGQSGGQTSQDAQGVNSGAGSEESRTQLRAMALDFIAALHRRAIHGLKLGRLIGLGGSVVSSAQLGT